MQSSKFFKIYNFVLVELLSSSAFLDEAVLKTEVCLMGLKSNPTSGIY